MVNTIGSASVFFCALAPGNGQFLLEKRDLHVPTLRVFVVLMQVNRGDVAGQNVPQSVKVAGLLQFLNNKWEVATTKTSLS